MDDARPEAPLSFLGSPLPRWVNRTAVTIDPGDVRPYDEAEWRDALVIVEQGEVVLECTRGGFTTFRAGDVMWLSDIPLRRMHNYGIEPTVIVAVSRSGRRGRRSGTDSHDRSAEMTTTTDPKQHGRSVHTMTEPSVERPHMPDYGVDTADWDGLPWSWAAERLAANRNFWVVTASREGRPHAMPVWGVWNDTEHRFAFSCGPRSRKAANLAVNPHVVVAIDGTVECVSIEGVATAVEGDRADTWIDRYLDRYSAEAPDLSAEFLRTNRIFEVHPERAFGIIEREDVFATRATRWRFSD